MRSASITQLVNKLQEAEMAGFANRSVMMITKKGLDVGLIEDIKIDQYGRICAVTANSMPTVDKSNSGRPKKEGRTVYDDALELIIKVVDDLQPVKVALQSKKINGICNDCEHLEKLINQMQGIGGVDDCETD